MLDVDQKALEAATEALQIGLNRQGVLFSPPTCEKLLLGALAALPSGAEPVAWRSTQGGVSLSSEQFPGAHPLYASPSSSPVSGGVRVKPLVWQMENVDGTMWTGYAPMSGQYLVKHNGKQWESICGMVVVGRFSTRVEAKAAAQSDYEARIRSALGEQP